MSLDLAGATLIDFDLDGGHVVDAVFDQATFSKDAGFAEAAFTGKAWFDGAVFTGGAFFNKATFDETASFDGVTFTGHAEFEKATSTVGIRLGIRLGWAVVGDPVADHVWPEGWRLETAPEGAGRLIREETGGAPAQGV
ncbi:pentapeptide repeat-containing protein [Streptosporangium canum]|uniref:pentapeptide repeat-containing protein n=1 Tax=Streptosporangium canum TaxID=324952 RepID=UPI003798C607